MGFQVADFKSEAIFCAFKMAESKWPTTILNFSSPSTKFEVLGALRFADFKSEVIFQNSKWRRQNGGSKFNFKIFRIELRHFKFLKNDFRFEITDPHNP